MKNLEFSIDYEQFQVQERRSPDGTLCYDFAWINGPGDSPFCFTTTSYILETASEVPNEAGRRSTTDLKAEATDFLKGFYGIGGIGEKSFPAHVPARDREVGDR